MENIDSLNVVIQHPSEVLNVAVQHPLGGFPEYSIDMHPLLSGLVALLVVGLITSILIPWLLKRKDNEQEGIKELIKVTDEVNVALTCLFSKIRDLNYSMDTVNNALTKAYESRFRFRIMAIKYFPKKDIADEYNKVIGELNDLWRSINKYEKAKAAHKKIEIDWNGLREYIEKLKKEWNVPIEEDKEVKDKLLITKIGIVTHPYDIYANWNQAIWARFEYIIFIELLNQKNFKVRPVKPLEQEEKEKRNGSNKEEVKHK